MANYLTLVCRHSHKVNLFYSLFFLLDLTWISLGFRGGSGVLGGRISTQLVYYFSPCEEMVLLSSLMLFDCSNDRHVVKFLCFVLG